MERFYGFAVLKLATFVLVVVLGFPAFAQVTEVAPDVVRAGTIADSRLNESSGLVASRRYPGVFWSHNDGNSPLLFAIRAGGGTVRALSVAGARFVDWEDIAKDNAGNLYLADIGENGRNGSLVTVYMLPEPSPAQRTPALVRRAWRLRFPDEAVDCEAFFVLRNVGYLIAKNRVDGRVGLYRYPLNSRAKTVTLQLITRIPVEGDVTAADITADGRRLGLLTEKGAHVIFINSNPASAGTAPQHFTPFENTFMEGGTFTPAGFRVTAESREIFLFTHPAFRAAP